MRPAPSPIRRLLVLVAALAAGALLCASQASWAQGGFGGTAMQKVQVDLIPEVTTVRPGDPFWAALRMRIAPEWHTYWSNPGDSGLATQVQWQLPAGVSAGALQWPVPGRLPVGPLMNYGFEREVVLPVRIDVPAGFAGPMLQVSGRAEWLVCRDVCIPEAAPVGFQLPVADVVASADPRWQSLFAQARSALPGTLNGWTASARVADGVLRIALRAPAGASLPPGELYFYNGLEGQVAHSKAQSVTRHQDGVLLEIPLQAQPVTPVERMSGLLVAAGGFGPDQPAAAMIEAPLSAGLASLGPALGTSMSTGAPSAPSGMVDAGPARSIGAGLALLLALAGGLLLNLMPCVFPVLSIKALAMVSHGAQHPQQLRSQGLAFGAGVLLSFWALAGLLIALRAGGEEIGWGFQLQSPAFVAALAILFTLLALNLAGVFETGLKVSAAAGNLPQRGGHLGALLTGMLAVAVAAPCTAPFMGAALGYALAQPALTAFAVFSALAVGMALPFVLLSFMPGAARRLPRPGPWMVSFRQAMVFPMFGTVAWLAWVLGMQAGVDAVSGLLAGLVLVAFGAWVYGRFAGPAASRGARSLATALTFASAAAGLYAAWPPADAAPAADGAKTSAAGIDWQPWTAERVAQLRAEGRPVFIDFTAAWCVTCQANKRLVLESAAVAGRISERNVAALRADWTRRDPAITAALSGFGRSGVPVYVLYLPGRSQPVMLPELLTRDIVLAALDGTAPGAVASTR